MSDNTIQEYSEVEEGVELATIAEYALGDMEQTLDELATLDPDDGYMQELVESAQQQLVQTRDYLKLTLAALVKAVEQRNEEIEKRVKLEDSLRHWELGLKHPDMLHPLVLSMVEDMRIGLGHDESVTHGIHLQMDHFADMLVELTGCHYDDAWNAIILLDEGFDYCDGVDNSMVAILDALARVASEMMQRDEMDDE